MEKWYLSAAVLFAVVVLVWQQWPLSEVARSAQQQVQAEERQSKQPAMDQPMFNSRLWNWLQEVEYWQWPPWPGKPAGFYPGTSPHGKFLKIYVNRHVAEDFDHPPTHSIIVKENYDQHKKIESITVMERAGPGFDQADQDWYWIKYQPDGQVARKDGKPQAGAVQSCIGCHEKAQGGDFIYSNDRK